MKQYANVSNTNSKLGAQILSINMPAGITCRPDAPCYKGCYAKHGHWLYSNVQKSLQENLEHYKENPKLFFDSIATQTALSRFVRYHSFVKRFVMNSVISLHRKNIIHIYGKFARIKSAKNGTTKQLFVQIAKRLIKPFSKHQKELRSNIWFGVLVALQTGNIKAYATS